MSVNLPNPGSYLASIGSHIVALREAMADLAQDADYLNAMGGATFLQAAPFSMPPSDANMVATIVGAATGGNSVVQSINAFIESAVPLTGGL